MNTNKIVDAVFFEGGAKQFISKNVSYDFDMDMKRCIWDKVNAKIYWGVFENVVNEFNVYIRNL